MKALVSAPRFGKNISYVVRDKMMFMMYDAQGSADGAAALSQT